MLMRDATLAYNGHHHPGSCLPRFSNESMEAEGRTGTFFDVHLQSFIRHLSLLLVSILDLHLTKLTHPFVLRSISPTLEEADASPVLTRACRTSDDVTELMQHCADNHYWAYKRVKDVAPHIQIRDQSISEVPTP